VTYLRNIDDYGDLETYIKGAQRNLECRDEPDNEYNSIYGEELGLRLALGKIKRMHKEAKAERDEIDAELKEARSK
jgi:hypothetical protein